ncbi:hypothetical protein MXB_247, partial [Myxobolus squamalis]
MTFSEYFIVGSVPISRRKDAVNKLRAVFVTSREEKFKEQIHTQNKNTLHLIENLVNNHSPLFSHSYISQGHNYAEKGLKACFSYVTDDAGAK